MVFKRRNPRSYAQIVRDLVYPRGGIRRSIQYVLHRMRRLPDQPHRIARGIFAGTFVNFPPVFGLQMLLAAGLAWVIRGNIVAALLATFISNPLTTPFIAMLCLKLGHWMLGIEAPMTFMTVYAAFTEAGVQLWHNFSAIFTGDVAHWDKLENFFWFIFWPYTVGSILPGLAASAAGYYLTLPLINAYQKLRAARLREGAERRKAMKGLLPARRAAGKSPSSGDDDTPSAA